MEDQQTSLVPFYRNCQHLISKSVDEEVSDFIKSAQLSQKLKFQVLQLQTETSLRAFTREKSQTTRIGGAPGTSQGRMSLLKSIWRFSTAATSQLLLAT